MGAYTRPALISGLIMMLLGGIYGAWSIMPSLSQLVSRTHRIGTLSLLEWVTLLLGFLFVQGLFERVIGTPMVSWDALVSWDKWAVDAAGRQSLGCYAMGGYP